MTKLDLMDEMNQTLDTLKEKMKLLSESIQELSSYVESNRFIPDTLEKQVMEGLREVGSMNTSLKTSYSTLTDTKFPNTIAELVESVETLKSAEEVRIRYDEIKQFISSLQSAREEIVFALDDMNKELDALDLDSMSVETLFEKTDKYKRLKEAFYEEDPIERFTKILFLKDIFSLDVIKGLNFNWITIEGNDTPEVEEATEVVEPQEEPEVDTTKDIGEDTTEVDTTKDATEDVEEEHEEFHVENTTQEPESEPLEEVQSVKTTTDSLWSSIEVTDESSLIWKEYSNLLTVEKSHKAGGTFGVKNFKNDMKEPSFPAKRDCLIECMKNGYVSEEEFQIRNHKPKNFYTYALNKLYKCGYLKKYTVQDAGSFYALTNKGATILEKQDAYALLHKAKHGAKMNPIKKNNVRDAANAAYVRLLDLFSSTLVGKKYSSDQYAKVKSTVDAEFFYSEYMINDIQSKIAFVGIVSEQFAQFKEFYDEIKANHHKIAHFIAIGVTREHGYEIAKWVKAITGNEQVYYCGLHDEDVCDLNGESVVVLKTVDKTETVEEETTKDLTQETIVEDTKEEVELVSQQEEETQEASVEEETIAEETHEEVQEEEVETKPLTTAQSVTFVHQEHVLNETVKDEDIDSEYVTLYHQMLATKDFYCASALLKAMSSKNSKYVADYKQLAYAINDPLAHCEYNSNSIFDIYYNDQQIISDYFVVAASIRNFYYNQFDYDYSLPQLHEVVTNSPLLSDTSLSTIVYELYNYKLHYHKGLDCYADYREKDRIQLEKDMKKIRHTAGDYYSNFVEGFKEDCSNKRFVFAHHILFGQKSDLCKLLEAVNKNDKDLLEYLEQYLKDEFIKDGADICRENIDISKVNATLEYGWEKATEMMRATKKTSDLMSSLRMNLYKKIDKVVGLLCDYYQLMNALESSDEGEAHKEYYKVKKKVLKNIEEALDHLTSQTTSDLLELGARNVLEQTLLEIKQCLDGSYQEGKAKYYYVDFLRSDFVLLDEDYMPVLTEIAELPEFSIMKRITQHFRNNKLSWDERLSQIYGVGEGKDDIGSAELIFQYLEEFGIEHTYQRNEDHDEEVLDVLYSYMNQIRERFIEDLELAQCNGRIDNTVENIKENIMIVMNSWYNWTKERKEFGFFAKILDEFKHKISSDAQHRAKELNSNLQMYLDTNPNWNEDDVIQKAVHNINERIEKQNYAAAEDLLNRLVTKDLDDESGFEQPDYLEEFFNEYDANYHKTANCGKPMKSLVFSQYGKDTKGANKILENWPRGIGTSETTICILLTVFGFSVDMVTKDQALPAFDSFLIKVKKPENGRKSNYKHPIAAFGSEAEEKGFRVVCMYGKTDGSRLIDSFKEIGNAKHTIIFLDYSLTKADRRTLARKIKTDLSGKIFIVVDRVAALYLANHYAATSVNRMLMAITMPFSSYQPYISSSSNLMPPEIFMGRKRELEQIESPTGVNIVYGGRQLGKTALLRMAKQNKNHNENGDRALIVDASGKDYKETCKLICAALYDEGIFFKEEITDDWGKLARMLKNRLTDEEHKIPYLLLMIDEADTFIDSCEEVKYEPFFQLKDVQAIGPRRFKFVVAGLRNIVRFKRKALDDNSVLPHFNSLTIKPFKYLEARELLEGPMSYLGFRFPKDSQTEILISTIFGTTNYFPGLIQLYCTKMIEAVKRDYAGYLESETPPYIIREDQIKKVLAQQSLQSDIREKFFITLKVGDDDYYEILALLIAYNYHLDPRNGGCNASEIQDLASMLGIRKVSELDLDKIEALMEEMRELNVLHYTVEGEYRFTRLSFLQMMGTKTQIENQLMRMMEEMEE